jgi:hypothetical protein
VSIPDKLLTVASVRPTVHSRRQKAVAATDLGYPARVPAPFQGSFYESKMSLCCQHLVQRYIYVISLTLFTSIEFVPLCSRKWIS